MHSLIPLSLLYAIIHSVNALIVPFQVRTGDSVYPATSLTRRGAIPIGNTGNAQYVSNITLGGATMPVLLDTGSSDLWVHFFDSTPSAAKDTGKQVTLSYAVGKASGNVQTLPAQLGNATVADQAFLNVVNTSTFASNFHQQGYDGLLGLGPNSGSVIRKKLNNDAGNSFLYRYFLQSKASTYFISFLLDRKNDPGATMKGQFTVNEVLSSLSNITSMPKLDVDKVNRLLKADQHWQALTDTNVGIIGPDGSPVQIDSIVPGAPKGQFVAVIDSGFTFSQVPRDVSDAIYGRVQGAYYDTQNEWWLIPCGQYLNITLNFGGQSYPVHPLDTVDDNFARVDNTGKKVCIGAFQPITSAFSLLGHYDMILGMSFLRNAYTLLDFGTWIDDGNDQQHPFIQMLSVTNVAAARSDFIQARLNGNDTISDSRWALLPVSQMQRSPISDEEKKKKYQEMILSRWPYIFAGCLVFVLLVIGCCIWRCCKRRKARRAAAVTKKAKEGDKFGDVFSKDASAKRQSYIPLEGSTTDLRSEYAQQPNLPYTAPDSRQSEHSQQSNYPQQNPSYGYPQHDGAHPQHDTYPPQRF